MCDKIVCVCDKVVGDKVVLDIVVRDQVVCGIQLYVKDGGVKKLVHVCLFVCVTS